MKELSLQKCKPCEGGEEPLSKSETEKYLQILSGWKSKDYIKIYKHYKFKDFISAIDFINKIAKIAEEEGHHPDILLFEWNKVKIKLYTHAIGGLSINDFILASKIDEIKV